MYPFERFTERAKKVLGLAQREAELTQHSYIGTEHLLLALIREANGLAGQVLLGFGVEFDRARAAVDAALSGSGPAPAAAPGPAIPTSRVKKVIEISFDEARRMGNNYVGTEHILLGLLVEGEGIAAHVLNDLGVTLDGARTEIERRLETLRAEAGRPSGFPPPLSRQVNEVMSRAGELAAGAGAAEVGLEHVERAIARWRAEQQ
ncbi:MAG TPA: Clp protease N-terminal domain-containing protein [Candidatus Dormibacteraeota bacterium]|jgi:ATP-dependent Clp protease ATP-binding subunit ClpC